MSDKPDHVYEGELEARIAELEADNARLRAENERLQDSADGMTDNAVDNGRRYHEARRTAERLEARCGELAATLLLIRDAAKGYHAEWTKHGLPIPEAFSFAARTTKLANRTISGNGSRVADVLAAAREWHKNMNDGYGQTRLYQAIDALDAGEGDDG